MVPAPLGLTRSEPNKHFIFSIASVIDMVTAPMKRESITSAEITMKVIQ